MVSDNKIVSTNFQGGNIGINPANATPSDSQRDIIVERNMIVRGSVHMGGDSITVRNNIFYSDLASMFSATGSNYGDIPGSLRPNNLYIYNNSIYTLVTATSESILYNATSGINSATNVTLKNNVVYAPASTTSVVIGGLGTPTITASNNTTNAQLKNTDPLFAVNPPVNPADFKPTGASYAIGSNNACSGLPCATSSVPLWTDFFGATRTSSYDMGAVNK